MNSHARKLYTLILLICASGAALYLARLRRVSHYDDQPITISNLDIGECWPSTGFKWPITVTNVTDEELRILEFQSSCNCSSVDPSSLVLPPRGQATCLLDIDLSKYVMGSLVEKVSPLRIQLVPLLDGKLPIYQMFEISAQVHHLIRISSEELSFGTLSFDDDPPSRELLVFHLRPGLDVDVQCEKTHAIVKQLAADRPTPDELDEKKDSFILKLNSSRFSEGISRFPIDIVVTDLESGKQAVTKLPGRVRLIPDIQVEPSPAWLGMVDNRTPITQEFRIYSVTGKTFTLSEKHPADLNIDMLKIELPKQVAPDSEHVFSIEFTPPSKRGYVKHKVPLSVFYDSGTLYELYIPVSFYVQTEGPND